MATTVERIPAEVFPPGEFIQDELDARGWTQADLAEIMGRDSNLVSALVTGKRSVTPETARCLASAFGTSAELWMNLESAFQLSKVERNDAIARRSFLYSNAPVQAMVRRGWLRFKESDDVERLESEYMRFFRLKALSETPAFHAHAARKSSPYNAQVTDEEMAWLHRAWHLASLIDAPRMTEQRLRDAFDALRAMRESPEELRRIPSVLRDAGIRFVVVENLPKAKIDGACFRLNKTAPVVALSLRYDRIDWFWHTLMHELTHIRYGHDAVVDSEIDATDGDKPQEEQVADQEAASFLVPQDELRDFILRVKPFFSKKKIAGFAARIGVHPGLVVGQLQHRGIISYAHNREMLVKVKDSVASTALTDGWGDVAPA